MKSPLPILLAILTFVMSEASGLQCYQCHINPSMNGTKKMCVHFDYSSKFVVDCPYSTMCMKKVIQLEIQKETILSEQRDCAQQRVVSQDYKGGHWQMKTEIKEPFQEECHQVDDKGERTPSSTYCYCRGNLCNSSPKTNQETTYTDLMGVIVVYNLLKFIKTLRLEEP